MTSEALARHAGIRRRKSAEMNSDPGFYKVCIGCLSISKRQARVCHLCGSYRFDECAEHVVAISAIMAESPFPRSAGTVPRLWDNPEFPESDITPLKPNNRIKLWQ